MPLAASAAESTPPATTHAQPWTVEEGDAAPTPYALLTAKITSTNPSTHSPGAGQDPPTGT